MRFTFKFLLLVAEGSWFWEECFAGAVSGGMGENRAFEYLAVARSLASEAGVLIRSATRSARSSAEELKSSSVDLVTEFDRRAEDIILSGIRSRYPDHGIISEESFPEGELAEVTWIVDPIDGTTNFIAGLPEVAVSIGIAVDGIVQAGVVYNPIRNEIFHSVRGHGAFLDDRQIHVNPNMTISQYAPNKPLSSTQPRNEFPTQYVDTMNLLLSLSSLGPLCVLSLAIVVLMKASQLCLNR